MSTRREMVAAYKAAITMGGAREFVLAQGTDDALALAAELEPTELRHAEEVAKSVAVLQGLMATPEPEAFDDKLAYYQARKDATDKFWDAFEGQDVAGVTITRRR